MQPGRRSAHDKEPVQTSQPIQEINCQDIGEAGFVLGKKLGRGTVQRGGAWEAHRIRQGICRQGCGSGGARRGRGGVSSITHRGGSSSACCAPSTRRGPALSHSHPSCDLSGHGLDAWWRGERAGTSTRTSRATMPRSSQPNVFWPPCGCDPIM